jgi:hypothetical protein
MLKWLIKSLLILVVFVPFATFLPLAAVAMMRSPEGAQVFFWLGPWSCCFWTLLYSQLSASKFWLGAEHVRQWRGANGGLLHTSFFACAWMFGALICSYFAEFALLVTTRSATFLPLATFSPLGFAWAWRRVRG